ncbi:aromatase/cyclase [Nonomuraea sp. NPDC046802]|uniref:type II toxin-antitoxin system RatA family toxin n=1 Tax=Nonomuraea sp. NPDC046802 TaxID=3154919 RepID=UPI0033C3F681
MPSVDVEVLIQAPLQEVWRTLNDVASYPQFMDNVRVVEVQPGSTAVERVSSWSVILKGSILEWTEREKVDSERHVITFEQIDGDLDYFAGSWSLEQRGDKIVASRLVVDFDIGIPLLAEMLNPVASRALADNSEQMLREIERRVTDT